MTVYIAAFTAEGTRLAMTLARGLGERCAVFAPARFAGEGVAPMGNLAHWTERAFAEAEGLVFVGACGIAVRAVAPLLRGKDADPAVVVVDVGARYAVSLLSGHLGGANGLTRRVAALCGAQPVITTATDVRGVFAVDAWAAANDAALLDVELIKVISGRLLEGAPVGLSSEFPVTGMPEGFTTGDCPAGISLSLGEDKRPYAQTLRLIPRIAYLGMGCRRGVCAQALEAAALETLERAGVSPRALAAVCTVDRKADEAGLLAFCEKYGLPLRAFPPEALMALTGAFSASQFVRQVTGADNVCERAAMAGCGEGVLLCSKTARDGVTTALAVRRWQAIF